jgi:hypothetical protein
MPDEYNKQLEQLVKLSQHEGWKAYAWNRAKELDAHPSGVYSGLAADLIKRMKETK